MCFVVSKPILQLMESSANLFVRLNSFPSPGIVRQNRKIIFLQLGIILVLFLQNLLAIVTLALFLQSENFNKMSPILV